MFAVDRESKMGGALANSWSLCGEVVRHPVLLQLLLLLLPLPLLQHLQHRAGWARYLLPLLVSFPLLLCGIFMERKLRLSNKFS
jgi:hypothetical protein